MVQLCIVKTVIENTVTTLFIKNLEIMENTVYSLISSDEHDRVLTDPAYRIQRKS